MAALDQEDPRNVAIRQNEAEARYMRQTTPKERAMDQRASFDEAALRQRSEVAVQRLGMEQQRVNIAEGRAGLSELRMKIAEEKARLLEADALSKAKRELTVMQEASGFLRDAVGMDPTKPEFDGQFQKMLSGYPNAAESKSVKEWIDYHRPIAESRRAEQAAVRKFTDDQNKQVLENQAAGELAEKLKLKPTGIRDGKVAFGDETGTQTVVTKDLTGMNTVTEKRPLGVPTQAPAAIPAAPTASTTPTADPLAGIVSSGGKIKKVGDKYNAFDKDGKYLGTFSVGK